MEDKEPKVPVVDGTEPDAASEQREESAETAAETAPEETLSAEQLSLEDKATDEDAEAARVLAMVEAAVYITEDPLSAKQIAAALGEPVDTVQQALDRLVAEYEKPEHGLVIRQLAEGYKIGTKAEHHESIRAFVKKLQKPLKLSMAALETLAVVAYKQPITAPEILDIRGVQGAGVLKTLLERKLITTAGRKNVVGKPILYRTTKEFLVQFGLKNINELPTLKEFEELARIALSDAEEVDAGRPEATDTEAAGQSPEQSAEAAEPAQEQETAEPKGPQSETSEPGENGGQNKKAASSDD